jgi:hypothetical protein
VLFSYFFFFEIDPISSHSEGIAVNKSITPKIVEIDTYMHLLNNFQVFTLLACNNAQNLSEEELVAALPDWSVTDSYAFSFLLFCYVSSFC